MNKPEIAGIIDDSHIRTGLFDDTSHNADTGTAYDNGNPF